MAQNKAQILAYSGTGNCYAAAKQLAELIDGEVEHLTADLFNQPEKITADTLVIIFPTYAYGMPATVKKFIKKNTFDVKYLCVLSTYGSKHGGALAEAIKAFKKRGQKVHYTNGAKSVENYVHVFGNRQIKEKMVQKRTTIQSQKMELIAQDILAKKENKRVMFRPFSSMVACIGRKAYSLLTARYRVLDTCTSCGICYRICPANAITMKEKPAKPGERIVGCSAGCSSCHCAIDKESEAKTKKVPKFNRKKCDHCQGCLQLCPQKALRFGRIKPNTPRYNHPDTNLKELLKR